MKGSHKNPQPVIPVYNRKTARNMLKRAQGNNRINSAWKLFQIKKFGGFKRYIQMRLFKTPKNQRREVAFQLRGR